MDCWKANKLELVLTASENYSCPQCKMKSSWSVTNVMLIPCEPLHSRTLKAELHFSKWHKALGFFPVFMAGGKLILISLCPEVYYITMYYISLYIISLKRTDKNYVWVFFPPLEVSVIWTWERGGWHSEGFWRSEKASQVGFCFCIFFLHLLEEGSAVCDPMVWSFYLE